MAVALVNTVVADNSGNYAGTGTTLATAATSLTGGNAALLFIRCNATASVSSIADTAGNTYTKLITSKINNGAVIGSGVNLEFWLAKNVTGNASNIVTVTYSGTVGGRVIVALQYSGCDTTNPWTNSAGEVHSTSATVTSNPWNTPSAPSSVLVLGCNIDDQTGAWTTPSGFTAEANSTNGVVQIFDQLFSTKQYPTATTITNSKTTSKDVMTVTLSATVSTGGSGGAWAFA